MSICPFISRCFEFLPCICILHSPYSDVFARASEEAVRHYDIQSRGCFPRWSHAHVFVALRKKAIPTAVSSGLDIGLSNLSLKMITLSFYSKYSPCACTRVHGIIIGGADKLANHIVHSHVQVFISCLCLGLCFLLPPRDFLPPTGRGHPPHLCWRASYGSDGEPFRPGWVYCRYLRQRPRGPTVVPHSNALARQTLRNEPSRGNHLLAGTHHGSHYGYRQYLLRELERLSRLPLPRRPRCHPTDRRTTYPSWVCRIFYGSHRILVRVSVLILIWVSRSHSERHAL